ncbi:hypothetical protein [Bradyrhizobium sp. 76]|uniref:hypothetical protein n=1 Tax=Bradyrhizobium sp. 76 TaxID=2782680 RepID=UPI001FF7E4D2|nr:hypothetical protein [Bradyrhizobium sp. 76]MCK1407851.1 hypothetical protein [Bradyrhizobium sp. 76]
MSMASTHVLLEMPTDPDFTVAWLNRAEEAEALWSAALRDREFADRVDLLHCDIIPNLSAFARETSDELKEKNCFAALEVYADGNGLLSREFGLMVRLGFFVYDGTCYQMDIPNSLTLFAVKQAAVGLRATGGDCVLTPERRLHMRSKWEAQAWQLSRNATKRLSLVKTRPDDAVDSQPDLGGRAGHQRKRLH